MHLILLFLTWLTLSSCIPEVKTPVKWRSYTQGLQEAKIKKKLVLVQFYAEWCPFCKQMDAFVLGKPEVQKWLTTTYVPIRVYENDPSLIKVRGKVMTEAQWREQIGFSGYPTHLMLTSEGRYITRFTGSRNTDDFLKLLQTGFQFNQRMMKDQ